MGPYGRVFVYLLVNYYIYRGIFGTEQTRRMFLVGQEGSGHHKKI